MSDDPFEFKSPPPKQVTTHTFYARADAMSDDMVERVAKAIWDDAYPGMRWGDDDKVHYEGLARAAIKAMREPTEAMLKAGMIHCGVDLASEYRAMIDKALEMGQATVRSDAMSDMTAERLISMMALAMQNAQIALQNAKRDDALDAALSSLTIVLKMEADYWQANLRRQSEGKAHE